MGCAECKLLTALKKEDYVEELVGVDIDSVILKAKAHTLRPLTYDYLHPRPTPLHIALMHGACELVTMETSTYVVIILGSIAQPDARLKDFDLVACVEMYVISYSVIILCAVYSNMVALTT